MQRAGPALTPHALSWTVRPTRPAWPAWAPRHPWCAPGSGGRKDVGDQFRRRRTVRARRPVGRGRLACGVDKGKAVCAVRNDDHIVQHQRLWRHRRRCGRLARWRCLHSDRVGRPNIGGGTAWRQSCGRRATIAGRIGHQRVPIRWRSWHRHPIAPPPPADRPYVSKLTDTTARAYVGPARHHAPPRATV